MGPSHHVGQPDEADSRHEGVVPRLMDPASTLVPTSEHISAQLGIGIEETNPGTGIPATIISVW
jgi:hypothetical protein